MMPCEGPNSDMMHDLHNEVATQGMTAPAMSGSATVEEVEMQLVHFVAFLTALSGLAIAVRLPHSFRDDAHPMQQKAMMVAAAATRASTVVCLPAGCPAVGDAARPLLHSAPPPPPPPLFSRMGP